MRGIMDDAGDSFDQIRAMYRTRGFAGRVGFGSRPAVIVVDFIIGFTEPGSPLWGDLEEPLSQTLRLLRSARESAVPIYFTTVEYAPDMKEAGLFPLKVAGLKYLVAGTRWVEIDPRLERRTEEPLVRKKYASAFFGTGLAEQLSGIDTLVITGCTTSGCVRATAVDALQYGFHAIVPEECVGDRAALPHLANLFDMDAKYADVVGVEEVLAYFDRMNAAARQSAQGGRT